jgi:solute carrier family 25 (mitochondrial phosphate transporter), member 3
LFLKGRSPPHDLRRISLQVIKTRAQTDPDEVDDNNQQSESHQRKGIVQSSMSIVEKEGVEGLLLGAQATIVGYFWYGLSIYPSYALFKRYISNQLLSYDYAISHGNEIALLAGASAAVVASFGLAPIEAARIRVVADPGKYKQLGLAGTLGVISSEDSQLGWTNLYTSLPSLLVRQVIFGSVKFLAFERACEYIFNALPELRDATWTCLAVSLVAGGWSGVVSAVFSQPADSALTYIAKDNQNGTRGTNILKQVQRMVSEGGLASLFRGLGSRCVWSGCIIAGQFLLYDVFRTMFGVDADNLNQIFELTLPASASVLSF